MTLVDFLKNPASYAEHPEWIEVIESDDSWVALAGEFAYKTYRPIKRDDRDLSTPMLREKAAQREVRLNRRLGGDIYLGVIPIYIQDGVYSFHGTGEVADFAVKMRRLPGDRMMPSVLRAGGPSDEEIDSLADLLSEYLASGKTVTKTSKAGTRGALDTNIRLWLGTLQDVLGDSDTLALLEGALLTFLAGADEQIEKRSAAGKICEGHGELTADHICLVNPPIIIGSSEGRERNGDILCDLAMLAVDIEHRGRPDVGNRLWDKIAVALEEKNDEPMWDFYQAYRALGRARLEVFTHTPDNVNRDEIERWVALSLNHARRHYSPRLFVTIGLMGTGKTTLTEALSGEFGIKRISSEEVSQKLFPADGEGRAKQNRLDPNQSDKVYNELLLRAREQLSRGLSVILDASFLHRANRERAMALAHEMHVKPLFIECRLSKSDTITRLDRRFKKNRTRPGSRPELYEDQAQLFEPVEELAGDDLRILNMNQPVPQLVEQIREAL